MELEESAMFRDLFQLFGDLAVIFTLVLLVLLVTAARFSEGSAAYWIQPDGTRIYADDPMAPFPLSRQ
jgi:hypothetical protein